MTIFDIVLGIKMYKRTQLLKFIQLVVSSSKAVSKSCLNCLQTQAIITFIDYRCIVTFPHNISYVSFVQKAPWRAKYNDGAVKSSRTRIS